jgi:hypothetical protein
MLRKLVGLFILALSSVGVSGKTGKSSDNRPAPTPINSKPQQVQANNSDVYKAMKTPEWWLVALGFPTLIFVGWQARETRKAAQATLKSAEATHTQIELYVNAERARMTMDVTNRGRSFSIEAENTGKAIAKVTYARGFSVVLPYGQALPSVPPYVCEAPSESDYVEWIHSGVKIDLLNDAGRYGLMADLSDVELCKNIRDKKVTLCVYGRICYGDGISSSERETRFCYEASVEEPLETYLAMGGPAIYRVET